VAPSPGFKGKSQVSTWLWAIARNKTLSAMRARLDEQLDDCMATAIVDPTEDAETTVDKRDRSAIVQQCLSQLSAIHREVLDLEHDRKARSHLPVARNIGRLGRGQRA
jgi:RNA polymerase sigma-70 factor (ECF subfamily)